jgi:CheY-like chemotaxis protein
MTSSIIADRMAGHRPRVLLAEDDPDLREVIATSLQRGGFEVLEAKDGLSFLDMVGPWLFGPELRPPADLIVSDVRMPGISGLSVLDGIRHVSPALPFILITAFPDPETRAEAERLNATFVLDKPFEMQALVSLAQRAIAAGTR